ncbi:hypothetical protein C8T65DRAFT_648871 [Cerioporus squamosus]|nr:hypothetical protein C8T65DRAFT_648871 [Cerioporus squamosus]
MCSCRNNQNEDLHPNGQRLIALRDMKRVPASKVTAEQVRRASDNWEGHSVLEDIDTQWGALPQGGALEGYGSS